MHHASFFPVLCDDGSSASDSEPILDFRLNVDAFGFLSSELVLCFENDSFNSLEPLRVNDCFELSDPFCLVCFFGSPVIPELCLRDGRFLPSSVISELLCLLDDRLLSSLDPLPGVCRWFLRRFGLSLAVVRSASALPSGSEKERVALCDSLFDEGISDFDLDRVVGFERLISGAESVAASDPSPSGTVADFEREVPLVLDLDTLISAAVFALDIVVGFERLLSDVIDLESEEFLASGSATDLENGFGPLVSGTAVGFDWAEDLELFISGFVIDFISVEDLELFISASVFDFERLAALECFISELLAELSSSDFLIDCFIPSLARLG